jgi:rhodanese-related sulfurtransferase
MTVYKTVMMNELEQAMKKGSIHVLDVRERDEYELGHIPGAMFTPLSEFMIHMDKIEMTKHYYVVCHSGSRSQVVAEYLGKQGYQVSNVMGGMSTYRGVKATGLK